jgi:tellurite resistance protein TerC
VNQRLGFGLAPKAFSAEALFLTDRQPTVIFVWITVFNFFAVPPEFQKRVLLYGVLGAIAMRAVLIYLGALLLAESHWILSLWAISAAYRAANAVRGQARAGGGEESGSGVDATSSQDHTRAPWGGLLCRRRRVRRATPLFVALVLVEASDLIYAVDSIPPIFAVTDDPFIVFSSNIFAILGLRAMYFMLADMLERFHLLKYGLAAILMFVGVKMLLLDVFKIPVLIALGVVVMMVFVSVAASLAASPHGRDARGRI